MNSASETRYDLKNNSFAWYDDAWAMAELLGRETGILYAVVSDTLLGFTATRLPGVDEAKNVVTPRPSVQEMPAVDIVFDRLKSPSTIRQHLLQMMNESTTPGR